jgi:type II secretory pathway component PulF
MARIRIAALAATLHRVGTALQAGMEMRAVWDREASRGLPAYRHQAAKVRDRLAAGDSLAESLAACDGYFPQLTRDLVDVGEKTGRLEEVLLGLADHYEHLRSLRRTFLMGIAWPCFQLIVALAVIGLLILVLGMIGGGIDILGSGLVGTSGLVIYLLLVALVFGGGALVVVAVMRGWLGPAPLQLAMQLPLLGGFLRTSALSRMAWTLSLALNSGLDARRAMKLTLRSTQNAHYTSQMRTVDESIQAGHEFHESLRQTGAFPDEFVNTLETAEISGTHGETLGRLASEYRSRARNAALGLTAAATVAVWVLVAMFLIFMIFRLASFYLGTINEALQGL